MPAGPVDPTAKLRAELLKVRNERAALGSQLRDVVRERNSLKDQLLAGRLMLDAALKGCADNCAHANLAAERGVQLVAMQARMDELQAANEAQDRRHDHSVGFVPEQRGRRR